MQITMTQSTQLCYVTQGFREDCAKLIGRFERLETVRFEGFSEIWKNMNFPLVFAGRRSLSELIEFCEDSLAIAKEFFLPPLTFQERIGGLYLLYALYFKMPVSGPKIRTKMEDWQDIIEMRAEIIQAEHHDASYILSKLMCTNAFAHCPFDHEICHKDVCPQFGLEKSYRLKIPRPRNSYSVMTDIKELASPGDILERVKILSEHYSAAKASDARNLILTDGRNDRSGECPNLYDSQFGEKLLHDVASLEESRKCINSGIIGDITNPKVYESKRDTHWKVRNTEIKKSSSNSNPVEHQHRRSFHLESVLSENEKLSESIASDSPFSE